MARMPAQGKKEEEIEDLVGAMADAGYGLAYDDSQGLIKKTRSGPNPYDSVQSFEESGATITTTDVIAFGGFAQLENKGSSTASRPTDDQQDDSTTNRYGLKINPNDYLVQVDATISSQNSGFSVAYITDSNGNVLVEKDISGNSTGDTITFNVELEPDTEYRLLMDDGGNSWTPGRTNSDLGSAASTQYIDITGTLSQYGYPVSYVDVTGYIGTKDATSGSIIIEWPHPDVYEWDVATFQKTLDGETVDVFVGYSTDGGSTWSRTNGGNPISRNYSLADDSNISPDTLVRIEADLSRADVANEPTLDAAIRSWKI